MKSYFLQYMDGYWNYYTKWNKPYRERQIPYDFTNMWNLKKKKKPNEQNITIIKIQRLDWWLPDGKGVMG